MFVGPVFTREITIAPRRPRTYFARAIYGLILVVLISTAWLVLTGTQLVRDVGDYARFGAMLFQILAPLQLVLALFFSAVMTAGAVAQEKDRKTLVLLLLTNLTNRELVLGKLMASLLYVLMLTLVSLPVFMLCALFGGVSFLQIARVYVVTVISVLAAGSLGSIIALWREKTFQALALTVLLLVLWIAIWEGIGFSHHALAVATSPWSAVREATLPYIANNTSSVGPLIRSMENIGPFVVIGAGLTILLNLTAVLMVRVWNPSREARQMTREEDTWRKESIWGAEHDAEKAEGGADSGSVVSEQSEATEDINAEPQATRHVWDNPIIWREVKTRAYGRKTLIIRLFYFVLFAMAAYACHAALAAPGVLDPVALGAPLAGLFFISLVLVNAQAVTSLTAERDMKALDLLLVSDLTPKEFVYGKLGGVFYNAKEMIILPLALCIYIWWNQGLSSMNLFYLISSLTTLYLFVATVGVHTGMNYGNSRTAIATSLGTIFFLFVGIGTCMWMMVAFSGSFEAQLQPFLAFMVGGGVGLYVGLGARNPSKAIGLASFLCPLATFYAVTSLLLNQPHLVFVAMVGAYGFTTVSMLIPAIDEFDVATGRTTAE